MQSLSLVHARRLLSDPSSSDGPTAGGSRPPLLQAMVEEMAAVLDTLDAHLTSKGSRGVASIHAMRLVSQPPPNIGSRAARNAEHKAAKKAAKKEAKKQGHRWCPPFDFVRDNCAAITCGKES
jgi:hypothetical protein